METFLRNVAEIDANDRRSLEHVVGRSLRENQQVMIQILDIGVEPDEAARRSAIGKAADIASQGRANAIAQGVTSVEADAVVDQAIQEVRQRKRS